MSLVKCPRCGLNYIQEEDELCSLCLKEVEGENAGQRNSATGIVPSEVFTIKNEPERFGYDGFKLYNSKNENVGIAFATETNGSTNGNLEFHFYEDYETTYGRWHRVKINGDSLTFEIVKSAVEKQGEYSVNADEWYKYR